MAYVRSVSPLLFVIAFTVGRINAAALQTSETSDLDDSSKKENDAPAYRSNEQGYVAVNESKLVIDLYRSQQPHESTPSHLLSEESDKNASPFVQVVINQPNANKGDEIAATDDSTANSSSQLIPPASVNATIKEIEKESKQKQGQIIIRYTFFSNLNFTFFRSAT